ncbi:hypothetical protein HZ326_25755 [Fusarium oxysporum f. sp. albedinis]|nr:hypothetical protein HZ326_25755 [Fusarium oxysporum f. sp. albedinis]
MSGVANPVSDVIIVMGHEPDASGGGYHRPQRKMAMTTNLLEMQHEGVPGQNRARKQTAPKSSGGVVEAVQSLKQLLGQDFNMNIEAMKAKFQLEATAQTVQALSQVRDQLIQACGELEQTQLQLDMLNKTETPRSSV